MGELLAHVRYGIVGVLSLVILVMVIFVGLAEGRIGPIEAVVIAVLVGGGLYFRMPDHFLSPRQDDVLFGLYVLFALGVIAIHVFVNDGQVTDGDLVQFGITFGAAAVIAAWTFLTHRDTE